MNVEAIVAILWVFVGFILLSLFLSIAAIGKVREPVKASTVVISFILWGFFVVFGIVPAAFILAG